VRITSDNKPVIFHDQKINRLLVKKRGKVKNYTFEELKSFQYKDGQKILSLEEFFSLVKGKIRMILDLKDKGSESVIIGLIRSYNLEKDVIVQSKHGDIIRICYDLAPNIKYALYRAFLGKIWFFGKILRLNKLMATIFYNLKVRPYPIRYLNLDGPFIYDEFLSIINEKKIKIILGALRVEKYIKNVNKWNVDIVNSDNPSMMREYLKDFNRKGSIA